ncbi:hypothetical protein [Halomonas koreensis]|uniref:Uncharacterized protein n=1 Tax=Halomonas koreensis TaxID=245385 RepID=A0ABU1G2H1_9GAMM|nr:hypothetical protein [Halomonas koreensis]MDR5867145.1 hypothetical protein [Halomonas koreensis]
MAAGAAVRYNARLFSAAGRVGRRAPHSFQIQANAMLETNPINHLIKDLSERTDVLRGYL